MDYAIIFFAQIVFVTITTVRWIILVKGNRILAAGMSFFEVLIYVYALGLVVNNLDNPYKLVLYAFGYSMGALVGSWLEEKLAYGYAVAQVVTKEPSDLARRLRERGLGVTSWEARGRDGAREVLLVVLRRKFTPRLFQMINEVDPTAFVLVEEPRTFRGGFLAKRLYDPSVAPGPKIKARLWWR